MARPDGWQAFYDELVAEFWEALDEQSQRFLEDEPIPEDVRRAACMIHPHPVGWYDNPIPNLDGRTAREVLKRRGGADRIRAILMDIAPHFLPDSELFNKVEQDR